MVLPMYRRAGKGPACRNVIFLVLTWAFGFMGISYAQEPDETHDKVYWSDSHEGIFRCNLDGSDSERLIRPDIRRPRRLALDIGGGRMYWTDAGTNAIYRANLDGSDIEPIASSLGAPRDIALDVAGGQIYWAEYRSHGDYAVGLILRSDLDGSNVESMQMEAEAIALDLVGGKIYWTDWRGRAIRRSNLDGTDFEYLFRYLRQYPGDIALDRVGGKIYWTNRMTGTIERANLDGSNAEVLLTELADPAYLALDVVEGKIYWTTAEGTIHRSNLDGSHVDDIGTGHPQDIALDVVEGKIYWTTAEGTIHRSNLDGSDVEELFAPAVRTTNGFAVEVVEGKLYWTDSLAGTIQRSDLDGSSREVVITGLDDPRGMALAGSRIYWVDLGTRKIQTADLDGSNIEDLVTGELVWDLSLDVAAAKIYWVGWGSIHRADLDGSNIDTLFTEAYSRCLVLDHIEGKIYWADETHPGTIHRSNLDGSNIEDLFDTVTPADSAPLGIALDAVRGKIYWTGVWRDPTAGWPHPSERITIIYRSDMDGSNIEQINGVPSGAPTGLAVITSVPTAVGLEWQALTLPVTSDLEANVPNPFNATTRIGYRLNTASPVRLEIYNALGQPVRTLVDRFQAAGRYQVRWDARDQQGDPVATGVYLAHLLYPDGMRTRRLLYLK